MNFACINDKDALYFFPLNEQEAVFSPIQAMDGTRYVLTEQEGVDFSQTVAAERVDNDLYLRLRSESESDSSIQIKDFFQFQGSVHSLSDTGEYRLHLSADSATAAGPVTLCNEYLGVQQDQPEAAVLKVMQQAAAFQALDQLAESLNPSAEPMPNAQETEPVLFLAAASEANATFAVIPSITALYDQAGNKRGQLVSGSVTDDKRPKLVGLGEPNTTLDILLNGEVVDSVTVDGQGNWSYTPVVPLEEGGQLFFVRDQTTGKTSANVVLIIDTMAPARASLSSVTDDTSGSPIAIAKDGHTRDNTPTLKGKAEANSLVIIYNDTTPIASIYADDNGNWSWTAIFLPDGTYALKVAAMDFAGNIGLPSVKHTITIDTQAPSQPKILEVLDDAGTSTGPLLNGAVTDDDTPTFSGTAEQGATVVIYDNGVEIGRVVAEDGTWSFTPEQPLAEGEHSFTATATDRVGNQSQASEAWDLTILVNVPAAPVVESVLDDAGTVTGALESGDFTDDSTPTISGSAEANATVIIYSNGEEIGRVEADNSGNWVFTPENPLADGEHSLTFVTLNGAGNSSEPSDPWVVNVDTQAPNAPTIGSVLDDVGVKTGELASGDVTDDQRPTLSGS
ncbi:hypothetical protein M2318_005491, partial [Metapseudomonas resinovorans]|uniref:Ig-like domain-containing protein n=1 Tax=Metapseudomonas resinovorans TaxID=53412 RepID=UPI003D2619D8